MRKSLFFVVLLSLVFVLSTSAFAKSSPYDPGTVYLSGDTNLNFMFGTDTIKPDQGDSMDFNHTIFGLGTRAGYFVIDGLEVGLGLNYDYDKMTYKYPGGGGDNTETASSYLFGLQGGYFFDIGGYDPFFMLLIGYEGISNESKPDGGDTTTDGVSGLGYDIALGMNFVLTDHVGLAPALFYSGASLSGESKTGSAEAAKYDYSASLYGLRMAINLFL